MDCVGCTTHTPSLLPAALVNDRLLLLLLYCPAQVFDEELHQLERVIRHLATAGVDALIVQVGVCVSVCVCVCACVPVCLCVYTVVAVEYSSSRQGKGEGKEPGHQVQVWSRYVQMCGWTYTQGEGTASHVCW